MNDIHSYILDKACQLQAQGVINRSVGHLADFLQCSAADCIEALAVAPFAVRNAFGLTDQAASDISNDPHKLQAFRGASPRGGSRLDAFRGRR